MWKASAVKASEWTRKPLINSSKKKAVSMAIMTLIRVLLDHAMVKKLAVGCGGSGKRRRMERVRVESPRG